MLDLTIIAIYLSVTLLIGIMSGKSIKNMRDYAIASKSFPIPILIATITATYIGSGMFMGMVGEIYKYGISYMLVLIAMPINIFIYGLFIAPKISAISYPITVGDIMHKHYGKPARIITGIVAAIQNIGLVGAQIMGLSYLFEHFLTIPYYLGVFISYAIVVFYSSFGGIRSVTMTDVFQFIILMIAIPTIYQVGLEKIGGISELLHHLPAGHLSLSPPKSQEWYFSATFIVSAIPLLGAGMMQRLFMSKDLSQARNSMFISGIFLIVFFVIITGIALISSALIPDITPKMVIPYIIDNVLPVGLKGFVVAGTMAVIMSSADSFLNIAGISIVHDVISPLKKNKLSDKHELLTTRILTALIGIIAMIIALNAPSLIYVAFKSDGYWASIVTIPLLAALFNIQSSPKAFIAGAVSGAIALFIYELWASTDYDMFGGIFGLAANMAVFAIITLYERNITKEPQNLQ
jgi:solute:Na+ symporter, SSS family